MEDSIRRRRIRRKNGLYRVVYHFAARKREAPIIVVVIGNLVPRCNQCPGRLKSRFVGTVVDTAGQPVVDNLVFDEV